VRKSALASRFILIAVLAVLAIVVVVCFASPAAPHSGGPPIGAFGVLEGAGLLFFAFAGYARIATLGEEVRSPEWTIPRAIPIALGITVVVYLAAALSTLTAARPSALATSAAPVATSAHAPAAARSLQADPV